MAKETGTLWYRAAAGIVHRERRNATPVRTFAAFDGNVEIRRVPASEAPLGLVLHRQPADIAWRVLDGALWRPILGPDEVPLNGGIEEFSRIMTDEQTFLAHAGRQGWLDNPFCEAPRGAGALFAAYPFGYPPKDQVDPGKIVSGDVDAAAEALLARASADLVEIEGVLHRRALPPMWGAIVGANLPYFMGDVAVVIPEIHTREHALFGIEEQDAAIAAADRIRGAVTDLTPAAARRDAARAPAIEEATFELLRGIPDADPLSLGLSRAADELEAELRSASLDRMSFQFVAAYVDFLRAARHRGAPDLVAAAAAGREMGGLLEAHSDWPLAGHALMIGLSESIRVQQALDLEADWLGDIHAAGPGR